MQEEAITLWTAVNGYLMKVKVEETREFTRQLLANLKANQPELFTDLADKKEITPEIEAQLKTTVAAFVERWKGVKK
jgi:F0F1-type ATP synthase alpha subunit